MGSKHSYADLFVNQSIPDGQTQGIQHMVEVLDEIVLEQVEVSVYIPNFVNGGDLKIRLISPNGTESVLAESHAYGMIVMYIYLVLIFFNRCHCVRDLRDH